MKFKEIFLESIKIDGIKIKTRETAREKIVTIYLGGEEIVKKYPRDWSDEDIKSDIKDYI